MKPQHGIHQDDRKQKILDMIKINDSVTVPELIELFGVTGATIRSDLRELESTNKLIRTHGGAISIGKRSFEVKPDSRPNDERKQVIARKALDFISEGDSIIMDTGTTNMELAKQIVANDIKDLTVITNDLKIAEILEHSKTVKLLLAGGSIRKEYHCTVGYQAIKFIKQFAVDKAFLGTSYLSLKNGYSTPNIQISEIKEVCMSVSKQTFILCDSTKMGKSSFCYFAGVEGVDMLITDKNIDQHYLDELNKTSLTVTLA